MTKAYTVYILIYTVYAFMIHMTEKEKAVKIMIANSSELPIYAQIREQIKEQILNGQLEEGTLLPSIRQLAKELKISVITTTRAYSDLEEEGFLHTVPGKGSMVASRNNTVIREQYLKRIEAGLETAIKTAKLVNVPEEELVTMLRNLWQIV